MSEIIAWIGFAICMALLFIALVVAPYNEKKARQSPYESGRGR